MNFRRRLLFAASAGSALLALAGCGGTPSPAPEPPPPPVATPTPTPAAGFDAQQGFHTLSLSYLAAANAFATAYAADCVDGGDVGKCQTAVSDFSQALKTWATGPWDSFPLWPATATADAAAVSQAVTAYADSLRGPAAATTIAGIRAGVDQANAAATAPVGGALSTLAHDLGLTGA